VGDNSTIFDPASPQAQAILTLFGLLTILSAVILVIVAGTTIYSLMRYRHQAGQDEPRQLFGNTRLELTWTIIPLLMVMVIFGFTFNTMRTADPPVDGQQPDLVITGHQWWWEVEYPKLGVVTANEIHIPVGQPLLVRLESADVIHDFWVPKLGRKMDMVPGHPNHIWLEAHEAGTYLGACSEFCGVQHAWMRLLVIAQPQSEFEVWQQQQLQIPQTPTTGEPAQGAKLFQQLTCVNCHTIAGTAAQAKAGPDLTHLTSRDTIGAGILENNSANLTRWLADPQAVKPGNHMPNFQLTEAEVNALVAYLEALQ
jgi:cytochrome c oxidase subunit 2